MQEKTKNQYHYSIEFESWNEHLTIQETRRAMLSSNRKIEFFSENELIKIIPAPQPRIISIKELVD